MSKAPSKQAPETGSLAVQPEQRPSLIAKFAHKYSVEPSKLLDTLKATAFKSDKVITNEQMMSLLIVADQYGLNPFTREVFAFPDKGGIVPLVSVDGWARIINEHPQFDGVEFVWDADDASMTCTMYRKDRSHPVVVTEYLAECKRGTGPWSSHPRRMLRHKAMIQAARIAFGFAGIYDEPSEAGLIAPEYVERVDGSGAQQAPAAQSSVGKLQQAIRASKATATDVEPMPAGGEGGEGGEGGTGGAAPSADDELFGTVAN